MSFLLVPLALLAGVLNTVQSGANATLAKGLGQPIAAALAVTLGNVAVYMVAALFVGLRWPGLGRAAQLPWWAWTGGICGAAYVLAVLFFAEKLGAAVFTGCTVTAAILTSVALDHFGLVGFKEHAFNVWRGLGVLLLLAGVGLISRF